MNNKILLFVKYPNNGAVKTRLAESVGERTASALYQCFVDDILTTLSGINAQILICYYPVHLKDKMVTWLGSQYGYIPQIGESLGERLQYCCNMSLNEGAEKIIVLASDIPEISEEIIKKAFSQLEDNDMVIGPSDDGGYYLIGFRKKSYDNNIFEDISWSSRLVFKETLDKMDGYQKRYFILDTLNDMDTIGDIRKFLIRNEGNFSAGAKTMEGIIERLDKLS
jgi:rSAM/selenodomain-associated transferase 1